MSSEQIVEPALLNDENQIEAGELDQNNNAEEIEAAAEPQVGQNLENEGIYLVNFTLTKTLFRAKFECIVINIFFSS